MTDDVFTPTPEPSRRPEEPAPPRIRLPLIGAVLILLGVAALFGATLLDLRQMRSQPLRNIVFSPEGDAPWEGAVTIRFQRIPDDAVAKSKFVEVARQMPDGESFLEDTGLGRNEGLIFLDALPPEAEDALVEGRLPRPGEPELLAGSLVRANEFGINGRPYAVVGKLERGVSALNFAYVTLSGDPGDGATTGWLDWEGVPKLAELESMEAVEDQRIVAGGNRTTPAVVALTFAGLAFWGGGGVLFFFHLFRVFDRYDVRWWAPFRTQRKTYGQLFAATHVFMYLGFFAAMAVATGHPRVHLGMQELVAKTFSEEGQLGYVGEAYTSENIPRAAAATFMNNFVVQTFLLTILPSVVVPLFGFLKTALSLTLAGFVMAPSWPGAAGSLSYHVVTMVVEFEAYIVAAFSTLAYQWSVLRGMVAGAGGRAVVEGLKGLASATGVAAILLATGAMYEAATLILLRA